MGQAPGKLPRRFKLQAFVIDSPAGADSYLDLRDDRIDACDLLGRQTNERGDDAAGTGRRGEELLGDA